MATLTKPMHKALKAIDAKTDKVISLTDFYRAMGLSNRGRYLVKHRMEERRLIAMTGDRNQLVTITFAGLQALKAAA